MRTAKAQLRHYRRMWKVVALMVLVGLGSSGILNVLHAPQQGGWVAKLIGGIPPVALLVCLELISGIPVASRFGKVVRLGSASLVAALAFFVSFEHQLAFITALGFSGNTSWAIPIIIDGWMVVASVSLFEVTAKVRELRMEILTAETAADESANVVAPPKAPTPPKGTAPQGRTATGNRANARRRKAPPTTALKAAVKTRDTDPPAVTAEPITPSVTVEMDPAMAEA